LNEAKNTDDALASARLFNEMQSDASDATCSQLIEISSKMVDERIQHF